MDIDQNEFTSMSRSERLQYIRELQSLQPDEIIFDAGAITPPDCTKCELLGGGTKIPWFTSVPLDLRKQ
jgi:hypothetical protein